jgi:hypothetical protein
MKNGMPETLSRFCDGPRQASVASRLAIHSLASVNPPLKLCGCGTLPQPQKDAERPASIGAEKA